MEITRDNHLSYMTKLVPQLAVAYFIQSYFYLNYGPEILAKEVVGFMGAGLIMMVVGFYLHDKFHKVRLHDNRLEISLAPLRVKQEVFYRDIVNIEIKDNNKNFSDVIIESKDGRTFKLHRIDNPRAVHKRIYGR